MAKILVAEDSATELKIIKDILKDTSHEVITAVDGEEAENSPRQSKTQRRCSIPRWWC